LNKKFKMFFVIFIGLIIVASGSVFYLLKENQLLKETVNNQRTETKKIQKNFKKVDEANQNLIKENQELKEEIQKLIEAFNTTQKENRDKSSRGAVRPSRSGITPRFILTQTGNVDHSQQQSLFDNLDNGLYQSKKIEVFFDVDDYNSWPDLGEWYVSCYTATVGECDANPSITASGRLVTPDFTVAVDNDVWPFGTIFYFDGLGFGIADDTGPAIKGEHRADFLVGSKKFAFATSGNRKVRLVYEPPKK